MTPKFTTTPGAPENQSVICGRWLTGQVCRSLWVCSPLTQIPITADMGMGGGGQQWGPRGIPGERRVLLRKSQGNQEARAKAEQGEGGECKRKTPDPSEIRGGRRIAGAGGEIKGVVKSVGRGARGQTCSSAAVGAPPCMYPIHSCLGRSCARHLQTDGKSALRWESQEHSLTFLRKCDSVAP